MKLALAEAVKAKEKGDVPVGAVIVKEGKVIARAHNSIETQKDPTAHAEVLAIRKAAKKLGSTKLFGADMYVTCEPCSMCSGAIILAHIENLYIGTCDKKTGACGSALDILRNDALNHKANVEFGMMQEQCSQILKDFFKELRQRGKRH